MKRMSGVRDILIVVLLVVNLATAVWATCNRTKEDGPIRDFVCDSPLGRMANSDVFYLPQRLQDCVYADNPCSGCELYYVDDYYRQLIHHPNCGGVRLDRGWVRSGSARQARNYRCYV